jgi:ATP-dependent Zn protease
MSTNLRFATAIHEAGHAVIGRVLGLPCGAVTIEPSDDDQELGHAVVGDPGRVWQRGDGPRRPLIEKSCVCLYAGREAERIIAGSAEVGDGPDCTKATSLICIIGVRGATFVSDDVWDRYEARLRARSRALVSKHRAQIERVAHALTARGKLTSEQVDELIA